MNNPYRGEVEVAFNGQPRILVFDWQAMAALQATFGETWYAMLPDKLGKDFEFTATVMAIGLKRHMPEATAEMILVTSPPIIPTLRAIMKAVNLATFGEEAPKPEPVTGDPLQPPAKTT
jgi:hypothetical protein